MKGSPPPTRFEIEAECESRRRQLWEQEGRIFALAAEGLQQKRRGDSPEAVAATLRFLKIQIGHWESTYYYLKQREQMLQQ